MKQTKLSPLQDRRRRLTPEQVETIISLKGSLTTAQIAKQFGVSWNSIYFLLNPDKLAESRAKSQEKGGIKRYYDKDKQIAMNKATKEYKQSLLNEGKL